MTYKPLRVSDAAKILQVSPATVRNWCNDGRLEHTRNAAGQRVFTRESLEHFVNPEAPDGSIKVFYTRSSSGSDVSSETQNSVLTAEFGEPDKVFSDKASGLNERRRGLNAMLQFIQESTKPVEVCCTTPDRLSRFGVSYLEKLITAYGGTLTAAGSNETKEPQDVLMSDFMSLLASFSGKFYRLRGWEQQRLLACKAVDEVDRRASE